MGLSVLVLAAALMATVTLNRCRSVLWFQGNGAVYVMNLLLGGGYVHGHCALVCGHSSCGMRLCQGSTCEHLVVQVSAVYNCNSSLQCITELW
jgi:hypothetical protein